MTKIAPWEPPLAGTELDHLVGALDRLRTTFRWKADGLDSAGLAQHIGISALTLGGLLKHLAAVEDTTFRWKLAGQHPGEMWRPETWGENDTEILSAVDDTPEQLYAAWDGPVARPAGRGPGERRAGPGGPRRRRRGQPRRAASPAVRPHRGVRPSHGPRRPAPRGGGRPGRRGPAAGLATGLGDPTDLDQAVVTAASVAASMRRPNDRTVASSSGPPTTR